MIPDVEIFRSIIKLSRVLDSDSFSHCFYLFWKLSRRQWTDEDFDFTAQEQKYDAMSIDQTVNHETFSSADSGRWKKSKLAHRQISSFASQQNISNVGRI